MKSLYTLCCMFILLFATPTHSFAKMETFAFMTFELPISWKIKDKKDSQITLISKDKKATLNIRLTPTRNITVEKFAKATMKAYGGYNFLLKAANIYYFDYIYGYEAAWGIVQLHNDNGIVITGRGTNDTISTIVESISFE